MEKMNQALEKMKMLVGMDVEDEEAAPQQESFMDDFNRNCTLSTKQDPYTITNGLKRNYLVTSTTWKMFKKIKCVVFVRCNQGELDMVIVELALSYGSIRSCRVQFVSIQNRLYGFAICLSTGIACTLLSMLVFFNPIKFGITFSFGNLLALGSTAFLIGPKRQVTMMLDPVRLYATAIYLASIIIALFSALYVRNKLLTLLAIVLEFGALIWYSLSYVPFARSMVSKVMMACFDTEF